MPALSPKQKETLAKARAARAAKAEAKKKKRAARAAAATTPEPTAPADTGAAPAPDAGAETAADAPAAEANATDAIAADIARESADENAAELASNGADTAAVRAEISVRPAPPDAPASAAPRGEETDEQRRLRYRRARVAIGQSAPFHYALHRGVTARMLRALGSGLAGVELGELKVLTYRTLPSGESRPVACTADKALALSLSEIGAYVAGTGYLDHPLAPAFLGLFGVAAAILTARFGAEKGDASSPEGDFHDVDVSAVAQAARHAA